MVQPTRSGPSPILPALAGAVAAVVLVGGAWLLLRSSDDETVAADGSPVSTVGDSPDSSTDTGTDGGADDTGSGDADAGVDDDSDPVPTTQRDTEDTTNGTTIADVPLTDLPAGAPDTFVAISSAAFELVRVNARTGEVSDFLGGWGLPEGEVNPEQALQFVELAPNGTIYVDDCCEPAYGTTFVVDGFFDPATSPQLAGLGPELSPDGSRLARSAQGSAVAISDASGAELGMFGDTDFSGVYTSALTWLDNTTLVITSSDGRVEEDVLQILDVSDPSSPQVIAERSAGPDGAFLAADVRADGDFVAVRRTGSGDVIAEVLDAGTAEVIVDFDLPDDVYDANYDAAGRFLLTVRESGQVDWYGAGQRGTLGSGFISADW